MKKELIISGLLLFGVANIAFAQSTVSGTLTGGSGNSSNTVTGTVTAPPSSGSVTGTVTAPSTNSGGATTGSGGNGSSPVVVDYCTNLTGVQSSLPAGYGVQNGTCTLLSSGSTATPGTPNTGGTVTGGTTSVPGVPNTGAGGNAMENIFVMTLATIAALGSAGYLIRRRA